MIKLIATDLDGTLLQNGSQSLSEETIQLIQEIQNSGILFAAASGRQYPNLYRLFGKASDEMAFICENGSLVRYRGKDILKAPMDRESGIRLMEDILNRPGCEMLLSGADTSYLIPKCDAFVDRMQNITKNNVTVIRSFDEVKEDFIKISVYEESGIMEHSAGYFIGRWQDQVKCTVSGYGWLDFVRKDVNKGTAIAALMRFFGVTADETAAFGDNYNDLEMLSAVKYGYVMDNAAEEIKLMYPYRTALVEDTLREILSNPTQNDSSGVHSVFMRKPAAFSDIQTA